MDRPAITRLVMAGLLGLAASTAIAQQPAHAGSASVSSPSGGRAGSDSTVGGLSVSPGLSFDPSPGQTTHTVSPSIERTTANTGNTAASSNTNDQISARLQLARGNVRPFGQLLKVIRRAAPGDVVRVKLRQRPRGPWIYDVTVLGADGRYVQLSLNASDGRIVSRKKR